MMTMEKLKSVLNADEPQYSQATKLDGEAFQYLCNVAMGDDPLMAAKAVYLGSLTGGKRSEDLLRAAVSSPEPIVRVAVAGAARNLSSSHRDLLLLRLLDDNDYGVRRTALKSVAGHATQALRKKVESMANQAGDLRDLATSVLDAASAKTS